jgi:hypothetical protein
MVFLQGLNSSYEEDTGNLHDPVLYKQYNNTFIVVASLSDSY